MLAGTLCAVVAFLAWGLSDFAAGIAAKHIPALMILWLSQWVGLIFAVAVLVVAGRTHLFTLAGPVVWWSAIAAVVETIGFLAFYRAFARGVISVVAPISAMGVIVPVAVDLISGRWPSWPVTCGIAAAVIGAGLLAGFARPAAGPRVISAEAILLAMTAALSFGFYLVFTAKAAAHDELVTGVLMKLVSLPLIAMLVLGSSLRRRTAGRRCATPATEPQPVEARPGSTKQVRPAGSRWSGVLKFMLLVGIADGVGNVGYALAANRTNLAVVAAIASLYPAVTLVLARFFLVERLDRRQQSGAGLALIGIALMST